MTESTAPDNTAPDKHGHPAQTADAGWEVGVRETVDVALPAVWTYLLGDGLAFWLGQTELATEKGAAYATSDGVVGEVRLYAEDSKIRLTWRPDDWPHDTTLQLSVRDSPTGTTIGIQHEHLADRDERRMMLGHWKNVIAQLAHGVETAR